MKPDHIAFSGLEHEADEHARWAQLDEPRRPLRRPRADWPEWVRFAVFYVCVFVVLGGWMSALRTLVEMLRASGVLK